ncbi:hypothetical protein BCR35DRAFT_265876 [Leucosporidium creatinivorum]|uniref:Uncharacterized protein n=1 Tax=Leucosporidium creatinivorum TaxID=106004 RepID=A0A1Y2FCT5_9BASI|nr:hypothetical protein BCR35DRAFT_265876 [Leucosporidium creatinivorum]
MTTAAILSLPTPSSSQPSTPGPLAPATPPTSTPPAVATSVGLAQRLRESTAQAHQDVMMPAVVHKLVKGQLSRSMHLRYLMLLHGVYSALEDALAAHATHPCLSGVYNPALLSRAGALESDCEYYTGEREWSERSEEGKALQKDKPDAVRQYEARLRDLGEKDEGETGERSPTLLLAHAYVRYLGDLSGGQAIARALRKSYSLPDSGEGSAFYEFYLPDTVSSNGLPERADLNETKRIKEWFREGLDRAGELMTEEERLRVLKEARDAFTYNIGVSGHLSPVRRSAR